MNQTVQYDLEERTLQFAKNINQFVNNLDRTISNIENGKQLVRSAGSVGANYIEANESLSKKDFVMRAKIAKKEAKESLFWLKLIQSDNIEQQKLTQEAIEIMKILGAIIEKSKV